MDERPEYPWYPSHLWFSTALIEAKGVIKVSCAELLCLAKAIGLALTHRVQLVQALDKQQSGLGIAH